VRNAFEYVEGKGPLYAMPTRGKVFLLLFFWLVSLLGYPLAMLSVALSILLLAVSSGIGTRFLAELKWFVLIALPLIIVIQMALTQHSGVLNPEFIFINLDFSADVLLKAATTWLRLFCLFGSAVLFVMTTNPLRLVQSLSKVRIVGRRIPDSVVFLFVFINRSISLMFEDLERIREVQKARGFSFKEAGFREKITTYSHLLVPLLTISLERAQKQAMALEMKGFGAQKGIVHRERGT
jgi:energy-coupling factor transporter transmembrane protein EcfT